MAGCVQREAKFLCSPTIPVLVSRAQNAEWDRHPSGPYDPTHLGGAHQMEAKNVHRRDVRRR